MKRIFLIILFPFILNAQSIWYVDRDATGSGNGTSWANAWTNFDENAGGVDWSAISGGDTIYVSGGTDSTAYSEVTSYGRLGFVATDSVLFTPQVIVCPSWETGHNGDVVITSASTSQNYIMRSENIHGVKFINFNFWIRDGDSSIGFGALYGNDITIDSCYFKAVGLNTGAFKVDGDRWEIAYSLFEQPWGDDVGSQDLVGINNDPSYTHYSTGSGIFRNNIIIYRNSNIGTESHRDGIQFSECARQEYYPDSITTIVVANNLIINESERGTGWNKMIYSYSPLLPYKFFVYNNILVNKNIDSGYRNVGIETPDIAPWAGIVENNWNLYMFNNTIITKGDGGIDSKILTSYTSDSTFVYNNLIICDSTMAEGLYNLDDGGHTTNHKEFNYNYYAVQGGIPNPFGFDYANLRTLSYWQGTWSRDLNSYFHINTDVTFSNKYGTSYSDYYTEAGRDSALDLSYFAYALPPNAPPLDEDALGNARSGSWDIGALEYQDGAVDTIPSFSFTALDNMELNTAYVGSSTFTGADSTFTVYTTTGARFNINSSGSLSTTPKTATNGDVVYVETLTGMSYSTGYSETIIAGGVSRSFTVTTKVEPVAPSSGTKVFNATNGVFRTSNGKVIRTQ